MVAPDVASVMVTDWAVVKVPVAGEITGVAAGVTGGPVFTVPPPPHPVKAAKANPKPALNISFPQGTASLVCICCLIVADLLSTLVANRGS
jgi:hypothetical protein